MIVRQIDLNYSCNSKYNYSDEILRSWYIGDFA